MVMQMVTGVVCKEIEKHTYIAVVSCLKRVKFQLIPAHMTAAAQLKQGSQDAWSREAGVEDKRQRVMVQMVVERRGILAQRSKDDEDWDGDGQRQGGQVGIHRCEQAAGNPGVVTQVKLGKIWGKVFERGQNHADEGQDVQGERDG